MVAAIMTNEMAAKRAFEEFYRKDIKVDAECPIPWGHSWLESRWNFWWAAWQAATKRQVEPLTVKEGDAK